MNILAFDTALGACSAAVLRTDGGGARLARRYETRAQGHAEALMPMIEAAMSEAGLAYAALDRIAVTVGPGTFTGTRIGVAAARGLALATGARLAGTTTLAVMAHRARARETVLDAEAIAVCVDARRGQIYMQIFDAAGAALSDALVCKPERAVALLPATARFAAVGSGAQALAQAGVATGRAVTAALPELQPDAAALARMAQELASSPQPIKPLYLRPPDAKPQAAGPAWRT